MKPRLALVGNAPLKRDMSEAIDSSERVIRCNEAKTLGGYSGTRTDILCITNTGAPAKRIIAERSVSREPKFPQLSEVWFPRHSDTHLLHLRTSNFDYPESEFEDLSSSIVQANALDGLPIKRFSAESNERAFEALQSEACKEFICPSTGFLALWHVLENPEYASFDKHLFGFTFKFWRGHPAEAEKRMIRKLCAARLDLHFIPVSAGFLSMLRNFFTKR